jgi:hypothetical protein
MGDLELFDLLHFEPGLLEEVAPLPLRVATHVGGVA